jgi:hypothetical protein
MTNRKIIPLGLILILILSAVPAFTKQEAPKSLTTSAKGKGTIKVGNEQFALHYVIVKLKEGGELELTLVSDITVFFSGTWTNAATGDNQVELKISGGATEGGVVGSGKLFMRNDGKSLDRMTLQAANKLRKKLVAVQFVAE